MNKKMILTGIFRNDDAAKAAISSLEKAGTNRDEIAALFADRSSGLAFRIREKTKASEGCAAGTVLGSLVGGSIAAFVSFTNATPTGVESLGFIDPLIATFSGIGMGTFIGASLGAFLGRKVPEHEAHVTEGNTKHGNILLAVKATEERKDEILHILKSTGGKFLTTSDRKFAKEVGAEFPEETENKQPIPTP